MICFHINFHLLNFLIREYTLIFLKISNFYFQTESQSCKRKVISIDTPWKTICSEKSIRAGLIIPDDVIKSFGGSMGDAANEKVALSYSITIESVKNNSTKSIESVKNNSTKRKHIEIE